MRMLRRIITFGVALSICLACVHARESRASAAEKATVKGRIEPEGAPRNRKTAPPSTVVWLTPLSLQDKDSVVDASPGTYKLLQKNKSFEPHILVVPVGSLVEFPNHDPFFHNV